MSSVKISDWPGLAIVLIILAYAFFAFLRQAHKILALRKLIEKTKTSNITTLTPGLVEINGYVLPAEGSLLKSPFSNKDCVYYKCTVEKPKSSGGKLGGTVKWQEAERVERGVKFFIKDDTDSVLVDPQGAVSCPNIISFT